MRFSVLVEVALRAGRRRPAGRHHRAGAARRSASTGVHGVRVGKRIRFDVDAADEAAAGPRSTTCAQRFLTNPVIEDAVDPHRAEAAVAG